MKRAFTLIELLVVIAIIAILAAILFPVFAQAKAAAKQTASLSNVKQIMTGYTMYSSDADDGSVPDLWQNRGDGEWITWMEVLNPYVKSTGIWVNPGQSSEPASVGVTDCTAIPGAKIVSHFTAPMWIPYNYYNWWGDTMFAGFPVKANEVNTREGGACYNLPAWASCTGIGEVAQPASVAVVIPGYMVAYPRPTRGTAFGWPCTTAFSANHGKPDAVDTRIHAFREGGNYGFADTHAKWYASKNFNGNASRPKNYGGANYPSSPYMVIQE